MEVEKVDDPLTLSNLFDLGTPAELRCRYIFRFYNVMNNGYLTFEEFR